MNSEELARKNWPSLLYDFLEARLEPQGASVIRFEGYVISVAFSDDEEFYVEVSKA